MRKQTHRLIYALFSLMTTFIIMISPIAVIAYASDSLEVQQTSNTAQHELLPDFMAQSNEDWVVQVERIVP